MKYDIKFGGDLPSLGVYLQLPCSSEDFPTFDMDEKCEFVQKVFALAECLQMH